MPKSTKGKRAGDLPQAAEPEPSDEFIVKNLSVVLSVLSVILLAAFNLRTEAGSHNLRASDIVLSAFTFYAWALAQVFRRNHYSGRRAVPVGTGAWIFVLVLINFALLLFFGSRTSFEIHRLLPWEVPETFTSAALCYLPLWVFNTHRGDPL